MGCRVCGKDLNLVLDLGNLYLSDFIKSEEEAERHDVILGKCSECGLIQLMGNVSLDKMYKEHYWYRSGLNASMLKDLKDIVEDIESRINIYDTDTVVDIGCNDGSLFKFYSGSPWKVGYDPAPNLQKTARKNCSYFINDYFSLGDMNYNKVKIITSIAMFYDLPDPNKFVKDIIKILDVDGFWVIQFTDLLSMIEVNAIDNICAEHLEYYRLEDIKNLVEKHGLEIFDVSYNKVNGGSVRIFVGFRGAHEVTNAVEKSLEYEREYLIYDSLEDMYDRIEEIKDSIWDYLDSVHTRNVYALAASTKGNTLLQLFEFNNKTIKAIGEINEDKFGLMTAGTNIPIIPEKEVLEANPDVIIILAWHFKDTFDKVLKEYVENGGTVLYPLPIPILITNKGKVYLW